MNKKVVLFVFNPDPMCFIHVLLNAMDMHRKSCDILVVIEGAAVTLVPELEKEEHQLHRMWKQADEKGLIHGVCMACSKKLGVLEKVKQAGFSLLDDMNGHPSMSGYIEKGYEVLIFG